MESLPKTDTHTNVQKQKKAKIKHIAYKQKKVKIARWTTCRKQTQIRIPKQNKVKIKHINI